MAKELKADKVTDTQLRNIINSTGCSILTALSPDTPDINLSALAKVVALQLYKIHCEDGKLDFDAAKQHLNAYNEAIVTYLENPTAAFVELNRKSIQ